MYNKPEQKRVRVSLRIYPLFPVHTVYQGLYIDSWTCCNKEQLKSR